MSLGSSRNHLYSFLYYTFNTRSLSINSYRAKTSASSGELCDQYYLIVVRVLSYRKSRAIEKGRIA